MCRSLSEMLDDLEYVESWGDDYLSPSPSYALTYEGEKFLAFLRRHLSLGGEESV